MKLNEFYGCVLVQTYTLDNPFSNFLKLLLIFTILHPDLQNLCIFLNLWPNPINMLALANTFSNKGKHNIFPNFITFLFFKPEYKSTSIFVRRILPYRFNIFFKKIKISIIFMFTWSFTMLIDTPEFLYCRYFCYGNQALVKVIFVWLVLIPETKGALKGELLLFHLDLDLINIMVYFIFWLFIYFQRYYIVAGEMGDGSSNRVNGEGIMFRGLQRWGNLNIVLGINL